MSRKKLNVGIQKVVWLLAVVVVVVGGGQLQYEEVITTLTWLYRVELLGHMIFCPP